ncbi:MAG TPA: hypothetical protein VMB51_04055 [Solirubrobacteraceae bacterium]|nr:hypothetical protein [Solirubrobacteraceae bacterium]
MQARDSSETRSLNAYPNIHAAAGMLGVAASTLSRRPDVHTQARGERDRVLLAAEVLRLASIFRRRSINDVAQALLEYAGKHAPQEASGVGEEIEHYFEDTGLGEGASEQLLTLAHRMLSPALCESIEAELDASGPALPDVIQGYPALPDEETPGAA